MPGSLVFGDLHVPFLMVTIPEIPSQLIYGSLSMWSMLIRMDSTRIKPWQAKLMHATLRPALGYLYRLREHMERRGFPPYDKLLKLTIAAYNAIHSLTVELHYMGCAGGSSTKTVHLLTFEAI